VCSCSEGNTDEGEMQFYFMNRSMYTLDKGEMHFVIVSFDTMIGIEILERGSIFFETLFLKCVGLA